jgi:hypothetical protein
LALQECENIGKKGAIAAIANADAAASAEPDIDRWIIVSSGGIDHGDREEGGCRMSGRRGLTIAFGDDPPPRVEGRLVDRVVEAVVADGQAADILLGKVPPPELFEIDATLSSRHGRSPKGKPPGYQGPQERFSPDGYLNQIANTMNFTTLVVARNSLSDVVMINISNLSNLT